MPNVRTVLVCDWNVLSVVNGYGIIDHGTIIIAHCLNVIIIIEVINVQ